MGKPTVFITGGTGFIGSFIIRQLLKTGHSVLALRRHTSSTFLSKSFENDVEWIEGDLHDIDSLEEGCQKSSLVVHSAALISLNPGHQKDLFSINVDGTGNLVNCCLENSTEKLVHISSMAALSEFSSEMAIDEDTVWRKGKLTTAYGLSKYSAEMEVFRAGAEGLKVTVLNPTVVLGPGHWDKGPGLMVASTYNGNKYYPIGTAGFVDVRDVAEIAVKSLSSEINAERFVVNGVNGSYREVLNEIASLLQKRNPHIALSKTIAWFASNAMRFISIIPGLKADIGRDAFKPIFLQQHFDASRSIQVLDHRYRTLHEALKYMCESYMKTKT